MNQPQSNIEISAADLGQGQLADEPMTRSEALAMRGSRSIDEIPAESRSSAT